MDMKQSGEWAELDLSGDPILLVGRRPKPKALEAFVIDLHDETFATMRAIAQTTIAELTSREAEDWHPNAAIEPGEQYLTVDVDDLPQPPIPTHRRGQDHSTDDSTVVAVPSDPQLSAAAALLRLVLVPGELDNLVPDELTAGNFRFYSLVWEEGDAGRPVA